MDAKRIIVIGGGIAGLSAVQAAREKDGEARIHLICGEKTVPYYRTKIYDLLGETPLDKLFVRNYQWFIDKNIQVINGRVTAIDRENKQIQLADGSNLAYDALVIATGGQGRHPALPGSDQERVTTFRTAADVRRLRESPGPAVIIGGGVLGLEAAWHLSLKGRPVTVIERGDWLLQRQLDPEAAAFFLRIAESAGIGIALRGDVSYIDEKNVVLTDSRAFEAAAVIFAAGTEPVTGLAQNAGLACAKGVVVDEHMATDDPGVFACGDCAEFQGRLEGRWPVSMAQGAVAGENAAGGSAVYRPQPAPYFINAMGVNIWSQGNINGEDAFSCRETAAKNFAKLFFSPEQTLQGAILIGSTAKAMELKKAIDQHMAKAEAIKILS
ncbi:MAG: FAD-dependent oxidoreductase [Firmicutes bacterium]|nr:FAD-dependent oxidoreductase [Bacillota bacterium]